MVAAKKAALIVEATALEERKSLNEQELHLKFLRFTDNDRKKKKWALNKGDNQLQLKAEIAKVEAEEVAYSVAGTYGAFTRMSSRVNQTDSHEIGQN